MGSLAGVLDYFNYVDNDEIPRLYEQSIVIYGRVQGSSSYNVAIGEFNLGAVYSSRAKRAETANDLDRCLANLELVLLHLREAARIFRTDNHMDSADNALRGVAQIEEDIRRIRIARAAEAAATTTRR